jgi:2-succinyl-5-enolpyruvyl-6-hydroxy-3-cyclohexene-1-carboxylate synthase
MNSHLAQTTLLNLARLGVREICIAAGARNIPLITALDHSCGLRLWNFFEERSAGFFALGRMMEKRAPVAVLTTSGTAVAELLPAVMEAYYQGLPLIVITADRPSNYRGSGAPQAVEQVGIFGLYAERTVDLEGHGDAQWPSAVGKRPLHINVCLTEPLVSESHGIDFSAWDDLTKPLIKPQLLDEARRAVIESFLQEREGLCIMVGGLHPEDAAQLKPTLAALQLPIIAEATAQLHTDPQLAPLLLKGGDSTIRRMDFRRIIRIGGVPSWRWWRDLEQRPDVRVLHFSHNAFPGLGRGESLAPMPLLWAKELPSLISPQPVTRAMQPSATASAKLARCITQHPLSEVSWLRQIAAVVPAGATIFLGNSLPIREWNLAVESLPAGTTVWANRGANGIDGLISTALGIAAEAEESWIILGDLSTLYDLAGLWPLTQIECKRVRIVVINNGGGKIFSRLESLREIPDTTRSMVENQHSIRFSGWATLWGLDYRAITKPEDLSDLSAGPVVLEVIPQDQQTDAFWQDWSAK